MHFKLSDTTIIPTSPFSNNGYTISNSALNSYEYTIKGHMLIASMVLTDSQLAITSKDAIKKELAHRLAEELIDKNCIDYTQGHDWANGSVMIRARAYAVPNTDVQILRTLYPPKK
jgi:hypothetical protein